MIPSPFGVTFTHIVVRFLKVKGISASFGSIEIQ
jgi:hypothetical protein